MRKLGSYTHSGWVNRALKAALFATGFIVLFSQGSDAATITVNPPDIYGRTFVDVVGDFVAGDDKTFMAKVGRPAEPEKVIVTLMSNGKPMVTRHYHRRLHPPHRHGNIRTSRQNVCKCVCVCVARVGREGTSGLSCEALRRANDTLDTLPAPGDDVRHPRL